MLVPHVDDSHGAGTAQRQVVAASSLPPVAKTSKCKTETNYCLQNRLSSYSPMAAVGQLRVMVIPIYRYILIHSFISALLIDSFMLKEEDEFYILCFVLLSGPCCVIFQFYSYLSS